MALFQCNYHSKTMNKFMNMNVILPNGENKLLDKDGKLAVLYLLHGYTDDYSRWLTQTSVDRYAEQFGVAVVMPDAGKSFYTDMAEGDPYFTYIADEVPETVKGWFPLSEDPEYTYIAGLSMGGYGAMKIAMTYPARFKAVASMSGALTAAQTAHIKMPPDSDEWLLRLNDEMPRIFGDLTKVVGTKHDVFWLTQEAVKAGKKLPNIYLCCGTEDFIYESTIAYKQVLDGLNIDYKYHEEADTHNWGFWDRQLVQFLDWITK